MNISLYYYSGPAIKLRKSTEMTGVASYTGAVARMNVSMIKPVLKLEESCANIVSANYCYISDFGRYYQIVDKEADENGLFTISCVEDVLASFSTGISQLHGIVARQKDNYDMYLKDERIPTGAHKAVNVYAFGSTPFLGKTTLADNNRVIMQVIGG